MASDAIVAELIWEVERILQTLRCDFSSYAIAAKKPFATEVVGDQNVGAAADTTTDADKDADKDQGDDEVFEVKLKVNESDFHQKSWGFLRR